VVEHMTTDAEQVLRWLSRNRVIELC